MFVIQLDARKSISKAIFNSKNYQVVHHAVEDDKPSYKVKNYNSHFKNK